MALAMGLWTACSDDDASGTSADGNGQVFSNKLAAGKDANLKLTYSGEELIGKDIQFTTADHQTASFELHYVLPGDDKTQLDGVALAATDSGYTFQGQGKASNVNTTFSYKGRLAKDGQLYFDVTDVQVPDNILAQQGTFLLPDSSFSQGIDNTTVKYGGETYCHINYKMSADSKPNVMSFALPLGLFFLDNVLDFTLRDVTFGKDGNITASYGSLPDTVQVANMTGTDTYRHPSAYHFQTSPKNLATYYFTDDTTLYVVPNVDMIVKTIEQNQAKTRASVAGGDNLLNSLSAITGVLRQWAVTGVRLTVKNQPYILEYFESMLEEFKDGNHYVVYVEKKDLKEFIALIDIARSLIPEATLKTNLIDLLKQNVQIPPEYEAMLSMLQLFFPDMTIGGILDQVKENLDECDPLNIGFNLKK